jgi:hypothetical protein
MAAYSLGAVTASSMIVTACATGAIIGAISGCVFILLILSAEKAHRLDKSLAGHITGLCSIPAFIFGGKWISSSLLSGVDLTPFLNWYIALVVAVFVLISAYPAVAWIQRMTQAPR